MIAYGLGEALRVLVLAPVLLSLALVKVRDLQLQALRPEFGRQFDRDLVVLPETVLDEFQSISKALYPAFSAMWQAAGWAGSPYYETDGTWKPSPQFTISVNSPAPWARLCVRTLIRSITQIFIQRTFLDCG